MQTSPHRTKPARHFLLREVHFHGPVRRPSSAKRGSSQVIDAVKSRSTADGFDTLFPVKEVKLVTHPRASTTEDAPDEAA